MKPSPKKAKDLGARSLINGFGAASVALLIFLGAYSAFKWLFTTAVAGIASVAIWEYVQLLKKKGLNPPIILSIVAAVLYIFALFLKTEGVFFHLPEIILGVTFFACFVRFAWAAKSPLLNIPSTFFGIVYIAVPLGLFVRVMYFFTLEGSANGVYLQGGWWIAYLIATTKSADVGGYFIGSYFGKRKLAHRLSPNKTLEGALGGLLASLLMSLFICYLAKKIGHTFEAFSYLQALCLGIVMGLVGQMGDLAESLLKRDAGVKDSNAIPGVGGILDMIDSLLFTAPVLYIFLTIVYT